jgi:hypothetical protein
VTFVWSKPSFKEKEKEEEHRLVLSLIRHESGGNQVVEVTDAKLMERLGMEPGVFYCYYKPSFLNSTDMTYKSATVAAQLINGTFRDEFKLKPNVLEILRERNQELGKEGFYTADFIDSEFDSCFERTYNVEFSARPDFAALKRFLRDGQPSDEDDSERPILFLYSRN